MALTRKISIFLGMAFLFVALAFAVSPSRAQEGGNGLQISPTRNEVSVSPGEQKTIALTLKNITNGPLSAKAVLNDFESDNVSGTPKMLVDPNSRTPYSLNSMLSGLTDVDLQPGETKEVQLTVNVPGNAAPGGYFGAVRYSVVPQGTDAERQIALNTSIAHLVFVDVPGDVVQQIRVNSLKMQNEDKARSIFFTAPNKSTLSVQNLGNGFSRPFGTVTISNTFGKQVNSYKVNDNEPRGIVLPNSSRSFTNDISGVKLPGKYTATASVAYGNGGEVVTYKSAFWYLPVWFLLVVLALVLIIVGGIYYLFRKRSSRRSAKR